MTFITILAALPDEYRFFQKLTPPWRLIRQKPFKAFTRSLPGKPSLLLVETGMGEEPLNRAAQWVLETQSPDLFLSIGFAGSLCKNFEVGDVLWGQTFVLWENGAGASDRFQTRIHSAALSDFCRSRDVRATQVVTVRRLEDKPALSAHFQNVPSIVDMESGFTTQTAFRKQIPFLCFRAISDGLNDVIDFSLDQITGPDGRVCIPKVLNAVCREPRLVRSFYASWKRSTKAGQQLGKVLAAFVNLPEETLRKVISETHVWSSLSKP